AADAEPIDLDRLVENAQIGGETLRQAAIIRNLQRLDIAVADDRDAWHPRAAQHGIVANPGVPALAIDPIWGGDLAAYSPDPDLIGRVANEAIDKDVGRHVAGRP